MKNSKKDIGYLSISKKAVPIHIKNLREIL